MIFAAGNMKYKPAKKFTSTCRFDKWFNGKPLSNKNLYTLNKSITTNGITARAMGWFL